LKFITFVPRKIVLESFVQEKQFVLKKCMVNL
jgi:hypothetical protein